jgi:hypothetical protein
MSGWQARQAMGSGNHVAPFIPTLYDEATTITYFQDTAVCRFALRFSHVIMLLL